MRIAQPFPQRGIQRMSKRQVNLYAGQCAIIAVDARLTRLLRCVPFTAFGFKELLERVCYYSV